MKIAVLAVAAVLLAGCSSSGGATSSPTTAAVTAPNPLASSSCALTQGGDVIYWTLTPGQPAVAQVLGDVDEVHCKHTYDPALVASENETGPGFCTIVARVADNPGYDEMANPAPRPKSPLVAVGQAC